MRALLSALVLVLGAPPALASACPSGELHDPVSGHCVRLQLDPAPAATAAPDTASPLSRSLDALSAPHTAADAPADCNPHTPQGRATCAGQPGYSPLIRSAPPGDDNRPAIANCLNDLEKASGRPDANALRLACGH